MSYIGVPVGNMLLECVIKLGDAVLFPCYYFEDCIVSGGVNAQDMELIQRVLEKNDDYYAELADSGMSMLLFQTEYSAERISSDTIVKNQIIYKANRLLDYLIIQQCIYSRPEYLMNVAGQLDRYIYFDVIDENYEILTPVVVGNKYYSMQPGLGLDVSEVNAADTDKLYQALFAARTDEVYNEYRAILGHTCDAMRIGDMNRCFTYLFTKVERMGRCEEFHFQRNKVRIISCLSENQEQFDMYSNQLYFYSKQIRTDIVHRGVNFLDQIPLKQAHRIINDLLALIIRFCIAVLDTDIKTFAQLDAYLTQQETRFQYQKPQPIQELIPNNWHEGSANAYAACISNMNLSAPVKFGNIMFLPKQEIYPASVYYRNYVIKDWGREDYDEVFYNFSAEDLEYAVEILKHGRYPDTAMAIILQQPYLPEHEEGPNGYAFLCDYICKEIEKGLSRFLIVSDAWRRDGVLPSKAGIFNQIRMIYRFDETTGELHPIPGRVYQGYYEPQMPYEAPDWMEIWSSEWNEVLSDTRTDTVAQMCKTALERVCDSYYIDDRNLRILYLFDVLDMLYPETTNGKTLKKRILAFACDSLEEYEEQSAVYEDLRSRIRNPMIHGGRSIYELSDSLQQIDENCRILEQWIVKYCMGVARLNISTMDQLDEAYADRQKSLR